MSELLDLADKYYTDKGTEKGSATGFALIYERLFGNLKNESIKLLEIGLNNGGPEHGGDRFERIIDSCPSIEMWHEYFQNGDIWGFDINSVDTSILDKLDRFTFFKGDQGSLESYQNLEKQLVERYGDDHLFDFVIEDGSHAFYHQQMSFTHLSKFVKPGGYYIIEDIRWQPDENKGGGKAGGGAPFDVSKLPKTVNTRKLFECLFINPYSRNVMERFNLPNATFVTDEQIAGKPSAFDHVPNGNDPSYYQIDLHNHINLLNERRPEYASILLNECRKYDRILLNKNVMSGRYASRVHYNALVMLRKKDY